MHLTRRLFLASAAAFAGLPANARGTTTLGGRAFGSYWRLTLPEGVPIGPVRTQVESVVDTVDRLMSPYRAGSEVSQFNALQEAGALALAPATALVTATALEIAHETGGAFDPTVGPLVARYGFGPIQGAVRGSFRELSFWAEGLRKARPGLTLDLCGIAKGHALDRIVAAVAALGVADFLVELGGEVAACGRHPEGRAWQVAVEGAGGQPVAVAELEGVSAASSGDSAQGYALGGRRYGHIIDPGAGRPAGGSLASVTVFDRSAMRADALATALFAMGREVAEDFARVRGIEAVLVTREAGLVMTARAEARILGEVG